ncbi:DNA translocase SftA [compost metagenome]
MITEILASSTIEIISHAFRRSPTVAQKCFRIKNLKPDEVISLVQIWQARSSALGLAGVRLVVAENVDGQIPADYVAEPNLSITYYRNHNQGGLVYLETRVQSDEQGLQNLFTLRDSNFLDGSFDEYAGTETTVPSLLLRKAWEIVVDDGTPAPTLLLERASLVIRLVHPEIEPVPIRRFVAFAAEVCGAWHDQTGAVDSEAADRIVAQCLWQLDMFPDPRWRDPTSDARTRRRLELNSRHAELMSAGSELDPEELRKSASSTQFVDDKGAPLPTAEITRFAQLCSEYAHTATEDLRCQIPYTIFEQLFRRDTAGLKLGDRIRSEIEQAAPVRLQELDAADLVGGLNSRSQSSAEELLGLGNLEGEPPLVDLLSNRTRRAVERLAAPPASRFFNPAIELVRVFLRLKNQDHTCQPSRIELHAAQPKDPSNAAHGLFVFLFGPTLAAISEALAGMPQACELDVAPDLVSQRAVPPLEEQQDEDDDAESVKWQPLGIRITIKGANDEIIEEINQLWDPQAISHFAMLWLLTADTGSPVWQAIGGLCLNETSEADEWTAPFVQRLLPLSEIRHAEHAMGKGSDALIDELLELRNSLREDLCNYGLATEPINSFLDNWHDILVRIRLQFIPNGSRPAALEALLCNDMIAIQESGRRLMLPLQPIRLRWISTYMEKCIRLATACLEGQAGFATGEGEQYLDWLESLSPHETPPTASGQTGEILFARSELAWFEDFAPLARVTADVTVDAHALSAIASRIRSYLEAHPYKRDGLSLLIVLPPSDDMPAELIRQVTRGPLAGLRVSLTVAAPKARWEHVARLVESLPVEERSTSRGLLFPARDLAFVEYSMGDNLPDLLNGQSFDISVVSHVLQESVQDQQNTEPPTERAGAFNPVVDRPVRMEPTGDGGAISIVMRPRDPDSILETWGTLVVRSNRSRPVSPSQPENTDFVELRVNFQDSARIFNALHSCSHWVITLERHISREQIESVEAGEPDVLSIETGIGGNGLSTLIVSSRSGRKLIESRLVRKLHKLIPETADHRMLDKMVTRLAQRIYEETRQLSPHLALQAMGVARVTEEILGMCIARRVAEQQVPARLSSGMTVWISLDEHSEWLGGSSQVRADMVRITFERNTSGTLNVDVLVLEGKLRQQFDPHGISQAKLTCEFFRAVLENAENGQRDKVDAEMWRERVLSAAETVADEARLIAAPEGWPGNPTKTPVPNDIRQLFREGKYKLGPVKGLYSACLWDSEDRDIILEEQDGVLIVRSARPHILELINRPVATVSETEVRNLLGTESLVEQSISAVTASPSLIEPPVAPTESTEKTKPSSWMPSSVTAKTDSVSDAGMPDTHDVAPPAAAQEPPPPQRGMAVAALRRMYDEVLGCFAAHNVNVSSASPEDEPFIEGPASILFKVRAGTGVDPKKLFEKAQALKLHLELDQEQNVSFDIDRGFVTIDVPKRPEYRYFVNASDMWKRWIPQMDTLSVPIGEDRFGELVSINFSSPNSPHLLVAGTTGSGKSEALNTILFGLVRHFSPSELKLLLVDPKGTELVTFDKCAYLQGDIGWDDTDAIGLLKLAVDEMQRRYALFRAKGKKSLAEFNNGESKEDKLPWWLIVLDEYADLTHDLQAKKEIEQELKRLAQKARAAGIHVIIATQKPSAEVISTNLRSNLPAQLALRVKSGTESRVVLDEAGAENLNGKGDALLKADGKISRVQCARVDLEDQVVISLDGLLAEIVD